MATSDHFGLELQIGVTTLGGATLGKHLERKSGQRGKGGRRGREKRGGRRRRRERKKRKKGNGGEPDNMPQAGHKERSGKD